EVVGRRREGVAIVSPMQVGNDVAGDECRDLVPVLRTGHRSIYTVPTWVARCSLKTLLALLTLRPRLAPAHPALAPAALVGESKHAVSLVGTRPDQRALRCGRYGPASRRSEQRDKGDSHRGRRHERRKDATHREPPL